MKIFLILGVLNTFFNALITAMEHHHLIDDAPFVRRFMRPFFILSLHVMLVILVS